MPAIDLPERTDALLARIALSMGKDKDALALEVIEEYLEDIYWSRRAEEAMKEFIESGEKSIPLDDVMKDVPDDIDDDLED
ncbi:MAG: hypothetical protein WBF53_01940 [Litorimonas sp.]